MGKVYSSHSSKQILSLITYIYMLLNFYFQLHRDDKLTINTFSTVYLSTFFFSIVCYYYYFFFGKCTFVQMLNYVNYFIFVIYFFLVNTTLTTI